MIDRRKKFREGLHPLYLKRYDKLCEILPIKWQPCQGRRTFEEQQKLFCQSKLGGPEVTRANAGDSAHNYGCATDWTLFDERGQPSWPEHSDSVWEEYGSACKDAGLKWGNSFDDYPHNQLPLSLPWKSIGQIFREKGIEAALILLQEHVLDD